MGSMAEPLKKEMIGKFGEAKWREHTNTVDGLWRGISRKIKDLRLDYPKLRIYQDGLPVCGKEREIVREVAGHGSRNYRLILELIKKGAKIEGTEDPKLLIEEYKFIKELTQIADPSEKKRAIKRYQKARDELLRKRDQFIAQRIDETLRDGDQGLLFVGLEHEIDRFLPKHIEVSYLIYRLPFKKFQRTGLPRPSGTESIKYGSPSIVQKK
jgi:hypothetical protein